jgi:hypothetical protein
MQRVQILIAGLGIQFLQFFLLTTALTLGLFALIQRESLAATLHGMWRTTVALIAAPIQKLKILLGDIVSSSPGKSDAAEDPQFLFKRALRGAHVALALGSLGLLSASFAKGYIDALPTQEAVQEFREARAELQSTTQRIVTIDSQLVPLEHAWAYNRPGLVMAYESGKRREATVAQGRVDSIVGVLRSRPAVAASDLLALANMLFTYAQAPGDIAWYERRVEALEESIRGLDSDLRGRLGFRLEDGSLLRSLGQNWQHALAVRAELASWPPDDPRPIVQPEFAELTSERQEAERTQAGLLDAMPLLDDNASFQLATLVLTTLAGMLLAFTMLWFGGVLLELTGLATDVAENVRRIRVASVAPVELPADSGYRNSTRSTAHEHA